MAKALNPGKLGVAKSLFEEMLSEPMTVSDTCHHMVTASLTPSESNCTAALIAATRDATIASWATTPRTLRKLILDVQRPPADTSSAC